MAPRADRPSDARPRRASLPAGTRSPLPRHSSQHAIEGIVALLTGESRDLSDVPLDFDDTVPEFHRRVYDVTRTIKPGTTLSYGEIAARVGEPDAARAVGQALGRNPIPIIVPCHRVLAANGGTGGFSAPGGTATKLQLLAIEGARLL